MRCLYREKKYYCGDFLEVEIYPVFKNAKSRRAKAKPSSEAQQLLNERNARKKVVRIIHTNFSAKDIKCELTYAQNPESDERAVKDLRNFFDRLKRFRAKAGLPELKYIAVTEKGSKSGRYHHHIIISGGVLPEDIARIWGLGYVRKIQPLQFNETGIVGLARYFTKCNIGGKRWNQSKNLKKPLEKQNDFRHSAKKVQEMGAQSDCREPFESLYPGYVFAECATMFNEVNTGHYLSIKLYRRDSGIMKGRRL